MGNFEKLRSLLKKSFPGHNVSVIRKKLKNNHGIWRELNDGTFRIEINKTDSITVQIDTLIHEWAHILVANKTFNSKNEHIAAWGKSYAQVYRLYEKNILNEDSE